MTQSEAPIFDPELGMLVWDEYTDLRDDSDSEPVAARPDYTVIDVRRIKHATRCHACHFVIPEHSLAAFALRGQDLLHFHTACEELPRG